MQVTRGVKNPAEKRVSIQDTNNAFALRLPVWHRRTPRAIR